MEAGTKEKGGKEREPHNYTPLGRASPGTPRYKGRWEVQPLFEVLQLQGRRQTP